MADDELLRVDVNAKRWEGLDVDDIQYAIPWKPIHEDEETGVSFFLMKYPAGFTNPWHYHDCGHGIYVLTGSLATPVGNFGQGQYVWFPERVQHYHGATNDDEVSFIFYTNKKFNIHYLHKNAADEARDRSVLLNDPEEIKKAWKAE